MEAQQTGTPPKKGRWSIFPYPIRRLVIIISIILILVLGTICVISVLQNWGAVYNILVAVLAVVALIIGLLAFWSDSNSGVTPVPEPSGAKPVVSPSQAGLPDSPALPDAPVTSYSPPARGNDGSPLSRAALLRELASLPIGTFQIVVSDLGIPAFNLSGLSAPSSVRAEEVLEFIGDEHLQQVKDALDRVKKKR